MQIGRLNEIKSRLYNIVHTIILTLFSYAIQAGRIGTSSVQTMAYNPSPIIVHKSNYVNTDRAYQKQSIAGDRKHRRGHRVHNYRYREAIHRVSAADGRLSAN